MIYIYALIDPITDNIRYVGKSIRPKSRLADEMRERSNCHRSHWLQKLRAQGLKPSQIILETLINDTDDWQSAERKWIAYGREHGWPLTNNTSGGDGVPDLPEETRKRMASTWLGRKHKPETIKLYSEQRKGRSHTEEHKQLMSKRMKGRVISPTHRLHLREAVQKLTVEQVQEIRALMAKNVRQYAIAEKFNVDKGTISNIKRGISYSHIPVVTDTLNDAEAPE